jgi:hypothetical protein
LSEGFRLRPSWRQACVNADFAAIYLAAGDFAAAARAARAAVNYEPRHLAAWQTLLEAQKGLKASPTDIEATFREFALAFKDYPDIEAPLVHAIAESMRARGETSAADAEENQFARKVAPERSDVNVDHAASLISQSLASDNLQRQIRTYYSVLKTYGNGAGMDFFSRIVQPFAQHLKDIGQPREALSTVLAAQQVLKIDPNSQLEGQMNELLASLRGD